MIFVELGNGAVLGTLTVTGLSEVTDRDQGAAPGIVNVAHQLGGTLGLGILVVVFASADAPMLEGKALLSHRISAALTGGGVMLIIAVIIALALIVPSEFQKRSPVATLRS